MQHSEHEREGAVNQTQSNQVISISANTCVGWLGVYGLQHFILSYFPVLEIKWCSVTALSWQIWLSHISQKDCLVLALWFCIFLVIQWVFKLLYVLFFQPKRNTKSPKLDIHWNAIVEQMYRNNQRVLKWQTIQCIAIVPYDQQRELSSYIYNVWLIKTPLHPFIGIQYISH